MNDNPRLIVMLTYNDRTVSDACHIFDQCKNSRAKYWGFKEEGLTLEQMKELFAFMKECGKTTFLEVVEYTEEKCLQGAKMAVECGCDILMGTMFFQSVNAFCKEHGLKYMPFVGKVTGRPSVLEGTVEEMIEEAQKCLTEGVFGFDLLAYRYTGDAVALYRKFISQVDAPVCLAGSVNSYKRLDEIKESDAWAFTIGSAFFDNAFDGTFGEQIDKVCTYIETP